jgi:hypothetical protein
MTIISTADGSTDSTPCPNTPTASVNSLVERLNTTGHPTSFSALVHQDRQNQIELNYAAELFASDDPEEKALGKELADQCLYISGNLFEGADKTLEFCDQLEQFAQYQKERAEELKFLAERSIQKAKDLRENTMNTLHEQRPELKTIQLAHHQMRSKLNTTCVITDESLIPSEYMTTSEPKPPITKPNKNLIKKTIQSGKEVSGAAIHEYRSWTSCKPKAKSKPQPKLQQQETPQLSPAVDEEDDW